MGGAYDYGLPRHLLNLETVKNISIAFTQVIPCKGYVELMLSYHKIPAGGDTAAVAGTIVNYKYMKK